MGGEQSRAAQTAAAPARERPQPSTMRRSSACSKAARQAATSTPAALPGVPSWRGALEDAFARSIELQHTWPAIALVVWRINATLASVPVAVVARPKGLGHGAMHLGPPADEAGGLQLPLLACGARCDIAPMMV